MKNAARLIILLFLLALAAVACSRPKRTDPLSPSKAHSDLIRICREDYSLHIVTRAFDRTLWIYLPMEENFLRMKANEKGPQATREAKVKPAVKYLDSAYTQNRFEITYDIAPERDYQKSYGYGSSYSENYQRHYQNILTAIFRAYGEFYQSETTGRMITPVPGDIIPDHPQKQSTHRALVEAHVRTETAPDFFVIVIADVVNGLETEGWVYLNDLKRSNTDSSFYEEYAKRVISNQPSGHTEIIGDHAGRHVPYRDLTWGEFLAKQMATRVNFKYQQSAFPPSGDPREEILKAAAAAIEAYGFTDFTGVTLNDLATGSLLTMPKKDLAGYAQPSSEGKLIHIRFQ